MRFMPEWWNWQTRRLQVPILLSAGSNPASGTIKVGVLTLRLAISEDAHRTRYFSTASRKLKEEASKGRLQTAFGIR